MKAASLLVLTLGLAALKQRTGYALPSNPAAPQASPQNSARTASDHRGDGVRGAAADDRRDPWEGRNSDIYRGRGRALATIRPASRATLSKVSRSKPLPNNRQASSPASAMNRQQPRSNKSGGAARDGFFRNKTTNVALAGRAPSVVRPTVPLLNHVRHRGPNSAVVAASTDAHSSTGAINGTRMSRRR